MSTTIRSSILAFLPRLGLLAAVFLLLLGSLTRPVSAAAEYDLTVLVLATGPGTDRVAISYSHVVNHSQLAAGVRALARATKVKVGEVAIREEPVLRGSQEQATSAEFAAPRLVRGGAGPFPVEAIARSLPDWQRMRLVFAVEESYRFSGPERGRTDDYQLELVGLAGATYQYDVERIDKEEQAPKEAGAEDRASGAPDGGAISFWGGIRLALIVLSAAVAVAAVWILVRAFRTEA